MLAVLNVSNMHATTCGNGKEAVTRNEYKRNWQRKARRNPVYRKKESAEIRFMQKIRLQNLPPTPRCFACERTRDLQPILRNVVIGNQLVEKTVLWCGC